MGKEYREGHSMFTECLVCVRSWKQPHIWALLVLFSFILSELYCIKISGWPKSLLGLFHSTLWKNLNEVFDQPSNSSSLPLLKSISFFFFFQRVQRLLIMASGHGGHWNLSIPFSMFTIVCWWLRRGGMLPSLFEMACE